MFGGFAPKIRFNRLFFLFFFFLPAGYTTTCATKLVAFSVSVDGRGERAEYCGILPSYASMK